MPNDAEEPESSPLDTEQARRLRESPLPPLALESRVIGALRHRGAFARKHRARNWALVTAGGIAVFVAGWVGGRFQRQRLASDGRPRFVLLLQQGESATVAGIAEEQRRRSEYGNWADRVSGAGRVLLGEPLADTGKELVASGSGEVPWNSGADTIGGMFIISAVDYQHAIEIARTCPHLKYGGRIEVRPIRTP